MIKQAFLQVKLDVTGDQLMSHFFIEQQKLRISLQENIQNKALLSHWQWGLGDGFVTSESLNHYEYAQSGDYKVTLSAYDTNGRLNQFSQSLTVDNLYCPAQTNVQIQPSIQTININNKNYQFDQQPITLNLNDSELAINLTDASKISERSIDWLLWLDANNDGVYQAPEELIWQKTAAANQQYALNLNVDLTPYLKGEEFIYARLIGDYAQINACSAHASRMIDLIITNKTVSP